MGASGKCQMLMHLAFQRCPCSSPRLRSEEAQLRVARLPRRVLHAWDLVGLFNFAGLRKTSYGFVPWLTSLEVRGSDEGTPEPRKRRKPTRSPPPQKLYHSFHPQPFRNRAFGIFWGCLGFYRRGSREGSRLHPHAGVTVRKRGERGAEKQQRRTLGKGG